MVFTDINQYSYDINQSKLSSLKVNLDHVNFILEEQNKTMVN